MHYIPFILKGLQHALYYYFCVSFSAIRARFKDSLDSNAVIVLRTSRGNCNLASSTSVESQIDSCGGCNYYPDVRNKQNRAAVYLPY